MLSVIVHVHVPAGKLLAVAEFCTGEVFQEIEYGSVPPEIFAVAFPVLLPKQSTSAVLVMLALSDP